MLKDKIFDQNAENLFSQESELKDSSKNDDKS